MSVQLQLVGASFGLGGNWNRVKGSQNCKTRFWTHEHSECARRATGRMPDVESSLLLQTSH